MTSTPDVWIVVQAAAGTLSALAATASVLVTYRTVKLASDEAALRRQAADRASDAYLLQAHGLLVDIMQRVDAGPLLIDLDPILDRLYAIPMGEITSPIGQSGLRHLQAGVAALHRSLGSASSYARGMAEIRAAEQLLLEALKRVE